MSPVLSPWAPGNVIVSLAGVDAGRRREELGAEHDGVVVLDDDRVAVAVDEAVVARAAVGVEDDRVARDQAVGRRERDRVVRRVDRGGRVVGAVAELLLELVVRGGDRDRAARGQLRAGGDRGGDRRVGAGVGGVAGDRDAAGGGAARRRVGVREAQGARGDVARGDRHRAAGADRGLGRGDVEVAGVDRADAGVGGGRGDRDAAAGDAADASRRRRTCPARAPRSSSRPRSRRRRSSTRTSPSSCARVTPSVRASGLLTLTATAPPTPLSEFAVAVLVPVAWTESGASGAAMSALVPTIASVTAAFVVVATGLAPEAATTPKVVSDASASAVLTPVAANVIAEAAVTSPSNCVVVAAGDGGDRRGDADADEAAGAAVGEGVRVVVRRRAQRQRAAGGDGGGRRGQGLHVGGVGDRRAGAGARAGDQTDDGDVRRGLGEVAAARARGDASGARDRAVEARGQRRGDRRVGLQQPEPDDAGGERVGPGVGLVALALGVRVDRDGAGDGDRGVRGRARPRWPRIRRPSR